MRTIEVKLYSFDELSEDAKQNAIEYYRKWQYENGEYLFFFSEVCEEHAKIAGFNCCEFQYSLSYCQGDGLSFSAESYDNLEELFKKHLGEGKEKTAKLLSENCTLVMTGNESRYCYASASQVDLYLENYTSGINCTNTDNIDNVVSKVLAELEDIYLGVCEELENIGYKEIEYQNSDDAIIETLIANEYEFTEDGEMFD